jgi:hypothetical protein
VARRVAKEWTVEEYEAWSKATDTFDDIANAADEVGGPRLSLVPLPEQNEAWPTDLLPPNPPPTSLGEGDHAEHGGGGEPIPATPFDGIPLEDSRKRLAGWSAERQKYFLTILAETGQVHLAAAAARLSVRSAQALRVRSPGFNAGWRMAEQLAVGRLSPLAFDRAINGRIEQVYQDGQLVAERRVPSDKLLTWLLARLDPEALRHAVGTTRRCRPTGRSRRRLRATARRHQGRDLLMLAHVPAHAE